MKYRYTIVENEMIIEHLVDAKALVLARRLGSFAKAARHMNMPVATFSRRIAKLESDANIRIFDRTTRSLHATEMGEKLIEHAQRLLDEADHAQTLLESFHDEPSGHIKVSAPHIFGQEYLQAIVSQFLSRYPKCNVFVELTNRRVDLVHEGYDLAIRLGDPGDLDGIAKYLGNLTAGLYRRLDKHAQVIETPEQLSNTDIALLRPKSAPWADLNLFNAEGAKITVPVQPRFVSTNPRLLQDVSIENGYVFVMPDFMQNQHNHNLEKILPELTTTTLEVFAVYTSRTHMRPSVRAFLDMLIEHVVL